MATSFASGVRTSGTTSPASWDTAYNSSTVPHNSPFSSLNGTDTQTHPTYNKSSFGNFPVASGLGAPGLGSNSGAAESCSSLSADFSFASNSSISSVARSASFSARNIPSPSSRMENYALGAVMFNQSPGPLRSSQLSSMSPGMGRNNYRRASAFDIDHAPIPQNSTSRKAPLTGYSNRTVPAHLTSHGDGYAYPNVLDRFPSLAQTTRDAEFFAYGVKHLQLNSDSSSISDVSSQSTPRHGSLSSNFFPSPATFSEELNGRMSPSYSRSNSFALESMWHNSPNSLTGVSAANSKYSTAHPEIYQAHNGSSHQFSFASTSSLPLSSHHYNTDSHFRNFCPLPAHTFHSASNSATNSPSASGPLEEVFRYVSPLPGHQDTENGVSSHQTQTHPISRAADVSIYDENNFNQPANYQQHQQLQAPVKQTSSAPAMTFKYSPSIPFHPQNGYPLDNFGGHTTQNKSSHNQSHGSESSGKKHRSEVSPGLRSAFLEEFRGPKNRNYELKDIYGHVVEFSGDQYGSRFIQQRLESASSEEKETIFEELQSNALQLMTDVFGNYVIQKFFELGNQMQKSILAKKMEGHVLSLSLQMYGCRVVQKAIEHVLTEQQAILIKELDSHILQCVKDQNGNHVVQKAVERIPAKHIDFIFEAFKSEVYNLATHPYGCRVIQRMLENCSGEFQQSILKELLGFTFHLVEDQYGNYVVQHVIERGSPSDRDQVMNIVLNSILSFSRHKFASNVVEKCIIHGSSVQRDHMIEKILTPRPDGVVPMNVMMKDQFANYVIQKLLDVTKGEQHDNLVDSIKPHLDQLKKFTYGKHLVSIEKLVIQSEQARGIFSDSS